MTALRPSQRILEAALAAERRKRVRKRLAAIDAILTGKSIKEAARAANTTQETVERCLERVRQSGLQSLLRDCRRRRPKWRMTAQQVEEIRRAIAATLARPLKPDVRTRLIAIDMMLAGQALAEAAASARVIPATVRTWLRLVAQNGLTPVLARWERKQLPQRPQIDADPAALRELAAKEKNRPRRNQMLALALVAEGMSPHAAALRVGARYRSLLDRMKRLQTAGIEAFHDKPHYGWARKLNPIQMRELRHEILRHPEADYPQLQDFVLTRYVVRYSLRGLRLLLKRDLRIIRDNGRFLDATAEAAAASDEEPLQYLNLQLLQAALARSPNSRARRKLIALIQLAQGWKADRVAFQVGVEPETLQRWVDLYCRFGIDALDRRPPLRSLQPSGLPDHQRSAVAHWIASNPGIGDAALCARLNLQFGAKYDRSIIRSVAAEIRTEIAASPKQPS